MIAAVLTILICRPRWPYALLPNQAVLGFRCFRYFTLLILVWIPRGPQCLLLNLCHHLNIACCKVISTLPVTLSFRISFSFFLQDFLSMALGFTWAPTSLTQGLPKHHLLFSILLSAHLLPRIHLGSCSLRGHTDAFCLASVSL